MAELTSADFETLLIWAKRDPENARKSIAVAAGLLDVVTEMRKAQREYLKTRDQESLKKARHLAEQVDKALGLENARPGVIVGPLFTDIIEE